MGKRLSTQTQIKRLRDAGYSRKELARIFNTSVSSVGRAERGAKGTTIAAPVREFFGLGKRARQNVASGAVSLPSAKPARPKKAKETGEVFGPVFISPLRRAEGKLSQLDGDTMVVVHITNAKTGKSRTLFARGGIEVDTIKNDLEGAIRRQAALQGRGNVGSISDPVVELDDVIDIDIQPY